MKLASCKHWLKHIACIHRPFGRARADYRMDLIYEQDYPAVRFLNLVKNGLVWLTTLRRPAMTQIEEHLFTMDINGIPPEDLNKFPTAETMVATTAYIEGNDGVTAEPMTVKYYRSNGVLHLVMDLVSGTAEAPVQMQVVLPVF